MILLPIFIFIIMEVYYVHNKNKLDTKYKNWDISKVRIFDIFYYALRIFYYIWLLFGLFTSKSFLFIIMISCILLKLPLYYISKIVYIVWENILPLLSIIFMIGLALNYLYIKFF